MLFMVIEQFRNVSLLRERFSIRGRMLPDGVAYQASWVDPERSRCYQVMEAESIERIRAWTEAWDDLVDFDIIPVVTSQQYWSA